MAERRKKWLVRVGDRLELTAHAVAQLQAEGYDVGMDGLGNYLSSGDLESAAMDSAAHHDELTRDGAKEGYGEIVRECAADHIYEGMRRALDEKRSHNQRVDVP